VAHFFSLVSVMQMMSGIEVKERRNS